MIPQRRREVRPIFFADDLYNVFLRWCRELQHDLIARTTKSNLRRATPAKLEPISKSSEEDNEAGELDKAEEVLGVILPADEDAALPLDPSEEALDEPASHVAA